MTPPRTGQWAAVWLGCAAVVLLGLAAAFLAYIHSNQMHELREQAVQTRARLMAQSISQRLTHATATGIPLAKLVGVPEFLDRWKKTHPEVMHIAVYSPQGQALWRSHADADLTDTAMTTAHAELMQDGTVQASVSVQLQSSHMEDRGMAAVWLVPAVLLLSTLAYLAAHFANTQGPQLRNHGLRVMVRWATQGDYRRLLVLPQRKHFDLRVQELTQAMRNVHERMARTRQLIGSLRRTEPQQLRRDYLDQILKETESDDHFADAEPQVLRLVAAQSQSLWIALLLCLGAVSPLTYVLLVFQHADPAADRWHGALPALSLALLSLAAVIGWALLSRLRLTMLSVLILSNLALLLPVLALLTGHAFHPGWMAAWNGFFVGAAMAACTRVQTHPDQHPGFLHAQPTLPGAALLAWWGSLLWLAPALGYYTYEALPPTVPALPLLLPIACALFFATRWDLAHSPWRVRMASMSSLPQPRRAWPLVVLGMAAGLMAGLMLHAISTQIDDHGPTLLLQCALGIGLGLAWSLWNARGNASPSGLVSPFVWRVLAWVAIALALTTCLASAFPLLVPQAWRDTAQGLGYLLLGLLLGHGFSQAAQQAQAWITPRLMLCGALGAALSAGLLAFGLPAWVSLLAALLLAIAAHAKRLTKAPDAS